MNTLKIATPISKDFGGGWWLRLDPVDDRPLIVDHPAGRVRVNPFPVMKSGPHEPDVYRGSGERMLSFSDGPTGLTIQIENDELKTNICGAPFTREDMLELWLTIARYRS